MDNYNLKYFSKEQMAEFFSLKGSLYTHFGRYVADFVQDTCVYTDTRTCTHMHAHTHAPTHTDRHMCTHMHARTHAHTPMCSI